MEAYVAEVAQDLYLLHILLDNLSLLDMLTSFALLTKESSKKYVRPRRV